jgi:hypothetical protein
VNPVVDLFKYQLRSDGLKTDTSDLTIAIEIRTRRTTKLRGRSKASMTDVLICDTVAGIQDHRGESHSTIANPRQTGAASVASEAEAAAMIASARLQ